jgi:hypothetical protein
MSIWPCWIWGCELGGCFVGGRVLGRVGQRFETPITTVSETVSIKEESSSSSEGVTS